MRHEVSGSLGRIESSKLLEEPEFAVNQLHFRCRVFVRVIGLGTVSAGTLRLGAVAKILAFRKLVFPVLADNEVWVKLVGFEMDRLLDPGWHTLQARSQSRLLEGYLGEEGSEVVNDVRSWDWTDVDGKVTELCCQSSLFECNGWDALGD